MAGPVEFCSELGPQAMQVNDYDYRDGFEEATRTRAGPAAFLACVERSGIMGSGGELHACAVRSLLEQWGDTAFSSALSGLSQQVNDRKFQTGGGRQPFKQTPLHCEA